MRKKGTWFIKDWLAYWQDMSSSSRWHRGRTISQQKIHIDCSITTGNISSTVKGSELYRQEIRCSPLDPVQQEQLKNILTEQPSLLMKIYTKDMRESFSEIPLLSSLFTIPPLHLSCTCPDEVVPCKHLIASAFTVGATFEEDPYQFVIFRGIPWEEVIENIQSKGRYLGHTGQGKYGMLPAPSQASSASMVNRWRTSPPFWTSPFPFPLIMEEIYTKVEETEEE